MIVLCQNKGEQPLPHIVVNRSYATYKEVILARYRRSHDGDTLPGDLSPNIVCTAGRCH